MGELAAHGTQRLTLALGPLRCELDPALGGSIAGLWWNGVPVLRETSAASPGDVRTSASYPLVPYSNRIGHARLLWQGQAHRLVPNFPPEPHAIHGVGWRRSWELEASDGASARLRLRHAPDADWPFGFDAQQEIRLSEHGIELTMQMTNRAAGAAPAGLGWHPYFVKRPGSHLRFDATGRWEMADDKLPTILQPATGLDVDCAALQVDHCFEGWSGALRLADERLVIDLESDLRHLVVFTDPARGFVAIEPVSHVNNALQLAPCVAPHADLLGVRSLEPGESMTAFMRLGVQGV